MSEDFAWGERILNASASVGEIIAYVQTDCYYSVKAASRYAGIGIKKIETAIRTGKLRAYAVGRKRLVKRSSIDAWIQAGEITRENKEIEKTTLQNLTDKALEQARANVAARKGQP